ncbi:DNA-methyltransferase [Bifidobacterium felsineum]|uniref:DNA-methyltransferase n=1 Tax=Bifidobacterium felsineum TaxID=2045440 RepID=UPI001BDC06BC|nr:site-specific DNA-methyltransferase [Bifidobacterium felsineum]MBT1164970.1 site-specific DNA-methyltransferase [Bifidobacterium felsineum]
MNEFEWDERRIRLHEGDCRDLIAGLPDDSVDAVVTDPPYELGFMGRDWDRTGIAYDVGLWRDVLRVVKPGAHMTVFAASRTYHRVACAIEDAGFEIRDQIDWVYATGMPHGQDAARLTGDGKWAGWNTMLKPAHEPIILARKPLDGSVADNLETWGTGCLNVDANRIPLGRDRTEYERRWTTNRNGRKPGSIYGTFNKRIAGEPGSGRFPPDMIFDETTARELDRQSGITVSRKGEPRASAHPGDGWGMTHTGAEYDDMGGASRYYPVFRYERKASEAERPDVDGVRHPTVKPVELMRWLVRLVTPSDGLVLEPFAGSGATLEACRLENRLCVAAELSADYIRLIRQRLDRPATPAVI